jgi:hypothetical protein
MGDTKYAYDANGNLANVTLPAGSFGYRYLAPDPLLPAKVSLPNTSHITNTYDSMARLTGKHLKNSSDTILDKSECVYKTGYGYLSAAPVAGSVGTAGR